jgi:glutamate/tyrosine decarboxylase-like PLP-dependent enzyme
MRNDEKSPSEETLDPEDWRTMKALGHRMVNDMMDYLATVRARPPAMPVPENVAVKFRQPLPMEPQGAEKAYQDFQENVLRVHMGLNAHPRFWGWVVGTGTPLGMLAEMLAAGINFNMPGGPFAPVMIENQVLAWLKEMLGYPVDASGLLVSGGSEANLIGLAVARNARAGFNIRKLGQQAAPRKMTLYCSEETHSSVQKAVELLGLGDESLRRIPVDDDYRIETEALEEAIRKDRVAGHQPFCVIGNAGTVNTGAFDDLKVLADVCSREGLWFHIDAAFGAWTALSPKLRHLVAGMDRADSLAFDLHKWMYMPFEIGCILVRREEDHYKTFTLTPDYFGHNIDMRMTSDYGIQVSRYFRSLKAWMSLKEHGVLKYGRLIQQNVDQAHYLAELIRASPELELLSPVVSNVVCFRYRGVGLDDTALNELNSKLPRLLMANGVAMISDTKLKGRFALRVAVVNHRSRREDFELLVRQIKQLGGSLTKP